MQLLAERCERIAATTKKLEKRRLVAEYFGLVDVAVAAQAAVFLSGLAFPVCDERTLNVGGALLWRVVQGLAHVSDEAMNAAYRRHGDLGAAAYDLLQGGAPAHGTLTVPEVADRFAEIAATRGTRSKEQLVRDLLARATALEAKYIVKIVVGDLRIGLKESLVEEAVAAAYGAAVEEVRHANMLLGDIGETLRLAHGRRLREARMRFFHPLGFMLASPAEDWAEALAGFTDGTGRVRVQVEDKYDGIRAQMHGGDPSHPGRVRIFSRTRDDVTHSYPELEAAFSGFNEPAILDGEILAWSHDPNGGPGRALPFSELQKRLGRKTTDAALLREAPVVFMAFDVLHADGELVLERPLEERARMLDALLARQPAEVSQRVLRAPAVEAHAVEEVEGLFAAARGRGNEGLMLKDPASPYTPGRRGSAWVKLKRELATLDVVVTSVEYGNGKRAAVLSDYTFAVRDGDRLRNVGKAYSGLTDAEIAELTAWFKEHTIEDFGHWRTVEPKVVLEVAFNNVMRSDRHDSGYALRFPRIVRIRADKPAGEIDTLERVREVFASQ